MEYIYNNMVDFHLTLCINYSRHHICGVIVSVLTSSAVDHGFET